MTQQQASQGSAKRFGQLVAQVWRDPALKQRLLADPTAVLAEHGIAIPDGVEPQVVENTDRATYFVFPRQPSADELSDEQLNHTTGGYHGCLADEFA
jgi:hypothetical protein